MAEVTITVGGAQHTLALPLGLDALEEAGDAIDRYQALMPEIRPHTDEGHQPPMRLLAKGGRAALEVFCIVINLKRPGAVDFEAVASQSSLQDATPLISAMNVALLGSGFVGSDDVGEPGGKRKSAAERPSRRNSAG